VNAHRYTRETPRFVFRTYLSKGRNNLNEAREPHEQRSRSDRGSIVIEAGNLVASMICPWWKIPFFPLASNYKLERPSTAHRRPQRGNIVIGWKMRKRFPRFMCPACARALQNKKGLHNHLCKPLNLLVPEVGIEPTWGRPRWILSPVRLPVSPLRRTWECIP
jgi:hypothetical protein